ncbi:hypothetical protein KBZ21_41235, partial [Streptomyces sp. A73]|nr:hypothetical protein [Streptomyces sp. A73]
AERLKNQSKPKNTSRTYRNQRDLFEAWCTREGRVAKPCTTTTGVITTSGHGWKLTDWLGVYAASPSKTYTITFDTAAMKAR